MDKRRPWQLATLLVVLTAAGAGCDHQDTDRLARVARCVAAKGEALTAGADGQLAGWPSFQANLDEMAPEARVAARLRWDKTLAGTAIQVRGREGIVELTGKVPDLTQRRRAVELAQATVGVTEVTDR